MKWYNINSCFWSHDWDKWKNKKSYHNKVYKIELIIQKRICKKCNKIQLREVYSG